MNELEDNRKSLVQTQNGNQFDALRKIKKRKVIAKEDVSPAQEEEKKEEELPSTIPEIVPPVEETSSRIIYCNPDKAERKTISSNFDPTSSNTASSSEAQLCLIALKPGERIFFSGAVLLCPLKQSVSSFGTIFAPKLNETSLKFWPIYSPKSNSLMCIEHYSTDSGSMAQFLASEDDTDAIYSILTDLAASLSPELLTDNETSIFAIKSLAWSGIGRIDECAPTYKEMTLDAEVLSSGPLGDVDLFYPILDAAPTLPLMNIQESWKDSVSRIKENACPVVFVVGGRNVGKTTYSKYLVNSLLNTHESVGYLDCDVSVPEFSPYGIATVNLVRNPLNGPSFTHQQLDLSKDGQSKYIFVGAKSARQDPDSYLEALISLYHHFCKNQPQVDDAAPLIIDADGWIKGMGFDLLVHFINTVNPDFIVCLEPPFTKSEYAGIILSGEIENALPEGAEILSVTSALDIYAKSKLNVTDLRTLSLHAYFSQTVDDPSEPVVYPRREKSNVPYWNFEMPISHRRPYSVDWDAGLGVMILHAEIEPSQTLFALNATLVALISSKATSGSKLVKSVDTEKSCVVGYGFIRSIQQKVNEDGSGSTVSFQIVTPLSPSELDRVNVIARGSGMEYPSVLYLAGASSLEDVPYTSTKVLDGIAGASSKPMRYNLQRRRLA